MIKDNIILLVKSSLCLQKMTDHRPRVEITHAIMIPDTMLPDVLVIIIIWENISKYFFTSLTVSFLQIKE